MGTHKSPRKLQCIFSWLNYFQVRQIPLQQHELFFGDPGRLQQFPISRESSLQYGQPVCLRNYEPFILPVFYDGMHRMHMAHGCAGIVEMQIAHRGGPKSVRKLPQLPEMRRQLRCQARVLVIDFKINRRADPRLMN